MSSEEYKLLDTISSPRELKKLPPEELSAYCDELRRYIIDECAVNPGHLASSLGAVELAAALHYVFDTPEDRIVWDVGHQTYAHKIITGRREAFKTKRQLNGISGFPRMSESEYDSFGGGHASVSISAAFGMAKAAELRGEKRQVVAVIGDGSMTGGLAFEGLNNAGASKRTNLLVILNDNNMAIDQATGALKNYLLKISTSVHYNRFKQRLWGLMSHTPRLLRLCQKAGNAVKQGLLNKSNFFESLNFRYFGPVDGHNLKELVRTLRALRDIEGPKLLHVMTVKGKGYLPAEHDQPAWHAPGRFNPDTGERISAPGGAARYQDVFGETLLELARRDERVVGVTPAMPSGCSMNILLREMPGRCFDVGIAEGHAVTFSAGLAAAGMVPFCNIYSSFMQRAYDNVIHDVAIQDLPVVMCLDPPRGLRYGRFRRRAGTDDRRADERTRTAQHDVYGPRIGTSLYDPLSAGARRGPAVARREVRDAARRTWPPPARGRRRGAVDRGDRRQRRRTGGRTRCRGRRERRALRPAVRETAG